MQQNERKKIRCPHCGAEYLFEEIFVADTIFGKPKIVKDENGRIEYVGKDDASLSEEYYCDYCHNKFVTTVDFSFTTRMVETFSEDFEMLLSAKDIWA